MITRKLIKLFSVAAAVLMTACTTGKEEKAIDITGTWDLIGIEVTKAAQLGDETVSVEITFNADKTFSITQTLGGGRAEEFAGSWQLAGNVLTGKYSNGKAWGSSYEVSVENSTLTMIPESKEEIYSYRKIK
jgi:hypothetical protein